MRAHLIENGIIVNTIEVESLDLLPDLELIDADKSGGTRGDLWNGAEVIPPLNQPSLPEPKDFADKLAEVLISKGVLTQKDLDQLK